jgi:hypothetical protein
MTNVISLIKVEKAKHFLMLARQFRKVNDVIFKTPNPDNTVSYTITLGKDHLITLKVATEHAAALDQELGGKPADGGLEFIVVDAKLEFYMPAAVELF